MSTQMNKSTYQRSYPWAKNPVKLHEAISDLESARRLDPSVIINEETLKERYIIRKGVLAPHAVQEDTEEHTNVPSVDQTEEEVATRPARKSKVAKEE